MENKRIPSDECGTQAVADAAGVMLLRSMREARDAPAVHKASLAALRAYRPEVVAFVCEGVDDKKVFFHWLRNLQINAKYEFIVCNGKDKVLKFRELLRRDASGLNRDVYFFVDKDFDALKGNPTGCDIYLTDTYSFENLLVSAEVLEEILIIDMHCHAEPQAREHIIKIFEEMYFSFLNVTRNHNLRIYLARRLGINSRPLPDKLSKLATVSLLTIGPAAKSVSDVIVLEREPSHAEVNLHAADFCRLEPKRDYRGKFALLFFSRWLELLGKDRNAEKSELFNNLTRPSSPATVQYSIDSIAARSLPPDSFKAFISAVFSSRQEFAPASSVAV